MARPLKGESNRKPANYYALEVRFDEWIDKRHKLTGESISDILNDLVYKGITQDDPKAVLAMQREKLTELARVVSEAEQEHDRTRDMSMQKAGALCRRLFINKPRSFIDEQYGKSIAEIMRATMLSREDAETAYHQEYVEKFGTLGEWRDGQASV